MPYPTLKQLAKPSRPRWWRRVAVGVVIAVVAIVGWKLLEPLLRSEATKRLMVHHSQIRERLGDGLDPLFDEQVDAGSNVVVLRGKFEIARDLSGYSGAGCADGFDAAFEDVLGLGVQEVEGRPRIRDEECHPLSTTIDVSVATHMVAANVAAARRVEDPPADLAVRGARSRVPVRTVTSRELHATHVLSNGHCLRGSGGDPICNALPGASTPHVADRSALPSRSAMIRATPGTNGCSSPAANRAASSGAYSDASAASWSLRASRHGATTSR
jgi:hypothetical protein